MKFIIGPFYDRLFIRQWMPKNDPKLIEDYLIPNLNNQSFGDRLRWLDKGQKIFSLLFKHKNNVTWDESDAEVFVQWDILKDQRRHTPTVPEYYTISRQRMKSAIHKLIKEDKLRELSQVSKNRKCYQILKVGSRRLEIPRRNFFDCEKFLFDAVITPSMDDHQDGNVRLQEEMSVNLNDTSLLMRDVPSYSFASPGSSAGEVWDYSFEGLEERSLYEDPLIKTDDNLEKYDPFWHPIGGWSDHDDDDDPMSLTESSWWEGDEIQLASIL